MASESKISSVLYNEYGLICGYKILGAYRNLVPGNQFSILIKAFPKILSPVPKFFLGLQFVTNIFNERIFRSNFREYDQLKASHNTPEKNLIFPSMTEKFSPWVGEGYMETAQGLSIKGCYVMEIFNVGKPSFEIS